MKSSDFDFDGEENLTNLPSFKAPKSSTKCSIHQGKNSDTYMNDWNKTLNEIAEKVFKKNLVEEKSKEKIYQEVSKEILKRRKELEI